MLSGYGLQQLTFAAGALADYPVRLTHDLGQQVELVAVSTKRAGAYLPTFQYTPVVLVSPMLRLATIPRRLHANGGFSSP
jgi:hypothetical protein